MRYELNNIGDFEKIPTQKWNKAKGIWCIYLYLDDESEKYWDVNIPSDLSDFDSSLDSETTKIVDVQKIIDTIDESENEEIMQVPSDK